MYKEVVSPTLWVCWAAMSVAVALAGPFGTFGTQPFVWRLCYWASLIATAIVIAILLRTFWRNALNGRPEWQEDFVVASSLAVVFGPMVVKLNCALVGLEVDETFGYSGVIGCVFVISIGTITFRHALRTPAGLPPITPPRDRLLSRIPAKTSGRLMRISSDNHHIRIMTDDGAEHRVLMRLRDAVEETNVEEGFYVHRSHWVATASVVGIKRVEGREMVELTCGTSLPIGPKYRENLAHVDVLNA